MFILAKNIATCFAWFDFENPEDSWWQTNREGLAV